MEPLANLTETSLTLLLLASVVFFGVGAGILVFYVALPAMRLAAMVKRSYGKRLGQDLSKMTSSELQFLILSFEKMLSDLEAQESRVRVLAAAVAHEVRNSSAAIRGVAEMLPASAGRHARQIRDESVQLERLAQSFLEFTRPVEPAVEDMDLAVLLKSVVTVQSAQARKRSVKLAAGGLGSAPTRGDPGLLRQLLGNLLSNAVRAAPRRGMVRAVVEEGPDAASFVVRVTDNGPGVSERIRKSLFEPFSGDGTGGTGLGLAIARRIAEGHGGSLDLEETGPRGAVFKVILPKGPIRRTLARPGRTADDKGGS